jgi:hypothetical protein
MPLRSCLILRITIAHPSRGVLSPSVTCHPVFGKSHRSAGSSGYRTLTLLGDPNRPITFYRTWHAVHDHECGEHDECHYYDKRQNPCFS